MYRNLQHLRRLLRPNQQNRLFSSHVEPNENTPIKFSTSEAAKRRVAPIVREENDMDQEFSKTLYDRIQGLEKAQLLQTYRFYKEQGKSVTDIEQRLREIEEEEAKLAQ